MTKIRLYQDIDGCLNASWNATVWRQDGDTDDAGYQQAWVHPEHGDHGEHVGPGGLRYKMEWNDRLITALNEMPLELVWTTTWRADALKVGKAMGLKLRPHRVLHPLNGFTSFPSIDWKWSAILQEQELNPSPFIAVDDEWDHVTPYKREALENLGGILISPDFNFGVNPKHVEIMKDYIIKHS